MQDAEYNSKMIEACKKLIAVNKTKIFFTKPIRIIRDQRELMVIYGCEMNIDESVLRVMDINELWHGLHPNQANVSYILKGLHQKLKETHEG